MPALQGKIAVVTGGSSGIGLATAKRFVKEGAYVFIMGRRQAIGYGLRADHPEDHRIRDETRIRDHDLIALFNEGKDAEKDDGLATGDNHHFFRCNVDPARLAHMLRDDLAQLRQTSRRAVMSEALVQGVACCVDDVGRRIEIGFSNLEMDNVAPLGLQRSRFD